MIEFIKDSTTQFLLEFILGVLTLGITIFSLIYYYKKKEFSKSVKEILLVESKKELAGVVDIVPWKLNETVDNVYLILIKLQNTGKVSIKGSDFEKPISINFDKASILEFKIYEKFPDNLNPKLTLFENNIEIEPLLLNSKEWFIIKILVADYFNKLKFDARINGISIIKDLKIKKSNLSFLANSIIALFGVVHLEKLPSEYKIMIIGSFASITLLVLLFYIFKKEIFK